MHPDRINLPVFPWLPPLPVTSHQGKAIHFVLFIYLLGHDQIPSGQSPKGG